MFYVYKITCLINDKIYIGQTNNLVQRWAQHKSSARCKVKSCQMITRAMIKYGYENFEFIEIASCETQEEVDELEKKYIAEFDSTNLKIGYNIDLGVGKHSDQTRQKISKGLKKFYEVNEPKHKGKPLTEEHKKLISKSSFGKSGTNNGKKFSKEWREKISGALNGKGRLSQRRFSPEIEKEICRLYIEEEMSMYAIAKED